MSTITYKLFPTQMRFVNSKAKYVMFSGGYAAGKTMALCCAMLKQAVIPGNQILLIRKTLVSLKKSTLVTLLTGNQPVLPPGSYKYNKSDSTIHLNGGATIHCMGCDNPEKLKSMNIGAAFLDEASEFTQAEWDEVTYRLRLPLGSRQLFCATNPGGPHHFLYKFFFEGNRKNREVITGKSTDNTSLPEDFVDELKRLEGTSRKRLVEGLWVAIEGAIFSDFSRDIHIKRVPDSMKFDEIVVGCDYGWQHPTALLVCGVSGDRLYVLYEWRKNQQLLRNIVAEAKLIQTRWNPTKWVHDPSAAGLAGELANLGFPIEGANNDVQAGIDRIRNRLKIENGETGLVVNDQCQELAAEMEQYTYQKDKEVPVKVKDDLCDALRYCVNYVDDQRPGYIHPTFPDDEPDKPDTEMEWQEVEELGVQQ